MAGKSVLKSRIKQKFDRIIQILHLRLSSLISVMRPKWQDFVETFAVIMSDEYTRYHYLIDRLKRSLIQVAIAPGLFLLVNSYLDVPMVNEPRLNDTPKNQLNLNFSYTSTVKFLPVS